MAYSVEDVGDDGVALNREMRLPQRLGGDAVRKLAGAPHLDAVVEDGERDRAAGDGVVVSVARSDGIGAFREGSLPDEGNQPLRARAVRGEPYLEENALISPDASNSVMATAMAS